MGQHRIERRTVGVPGIWNAALTRDQALVVTRYWLSRQRPWFRVRWVAGPAAISRHFPEQDDGVTGPALERLLDLNRDRLTGRIDEAELNDALAVLADEVTGEPVLTGAKIEHQLIGLAVHVLRNRAETKDWPPYRFADTVWAMLEDEKIRPILEQALEDDEPPTVRQSIEGAIRTVRN
jgi:hypothetical protein